MCIYGILFYYSPTYVVMDVEKGEYSFTAGDSANCAVTMKIGMEILQKARDKSTICPGIPLLGIFPKEYSSANVLAHPCSLLLYSQ